MDDQADEHYIEPLKADDLGAVWSRLAVVIAEMGGDVVDGTTDYLHATFESFVFGFIDDLECLVDAEAVVIHCRSAARSGHYDFGVNRDRIEEIRGHL